MQFYLALSQVKDLTKKKEGLFAKSHYTVLKMPLKQNPPFFY